MLLLTRDVLTSLGLCASIIAWWGPFGLSAISGGQQVTLLLLVSTPILISMALGALISKLTRLNVGLATYTSIAPYYVAGTLYFSTSTRAPDVDFAIALPMWLSLLALGVVISSRVVGYTFNYSKGP